jgi:DNA adenine methylase
MREENRSPELGQRPFLKWPGGKRWAARKIVPIIREHLCGTYYEPFLGGGAVFFALAAGKAVLSDLNPDLINVYKQVKSNVGDVLKELKRIPVSGATYYKIRADRPQDPLMRAVRFLYLNRTAFAGMYRVNRRGEFNVPYGGGDRTPRILWENGLLNSAAPLLRRTTILCQDFGDILSDVMRGDVVYCDPTYTVAHDNNCFRRYNRSNFSDTDQARLANAAEAAAKKGATVIVSNAHHASIRAVHCRATRTIVLTRTSCVAPQVKDRRLVKEYLFIYCAR